MTYEDGFEVGRNASPGVRPMVVIARAELEVAGTRFHKIEGGPTKEQVLASHEWIRGYWDGLEEGQIAETA